VIQGIALIFPSRQAAESYRLAACAPQTRAAKLLSKSVSPVRWSPAQRLYKKGYLKSEKKFFLNGSDLLP
jgi:hypothetical protein